jgi:pyruvate dehydrogenase E2 component (dihydrolipoamide acetyltransferase)
MVEVDLTRSLLARSDAHADRMDPDPGLVLLPRLTVAVVAVLGRHPLLNASIDGEAATVARREHIDLEVRVSSASGTQATLLRDAATFDEDRISGALADRSHPSQPPGPDAREGAASFSVIYRSDGPVLMETPPLLPGTVGALAFGTVERRPVAADDAGMAIRVAWTSYLCLTYDHRLIDGADAARFLADLAAFLEADPRS